MKLITKIGTGIGLGIITWCFYQHNLSNRISQQLLKKQLQIRNVWNLLQNTKTSVQQLERTIPLLNLTQSKKSHQLLKEEQLQLRQSIIRLMNQTKN